MDYRHKIAIESCVKKVHEQQGTIEKAQEMNDELEKTYDKAKAFDEISKYVKRKLSAEVPLDDDYLIGRFESYETIQELMERE
ncbi:hypothetical protein ABDK10_05435 [Staphylococcus aureus]